MKAVLLFAVLALAFSSGLAGDQECNPDGDGRPTCEVLGVFRNNWDPVHYWDCMEVGADPVSKQCPITKLFDAEKRECVDNDEWTWVPPCPAAA